MSQIEDDDSKPWTEHDLREAIRRINAGEINFKEAENYYGISPRTIYRQRAIENMRAQLNPEKAKKLKAAAASTAKKDVTILRKPVGISCSSISDVVSLLSEGTEEVKQLLNYECNLIYECKVCKNLFRSLLNFVSHKRIYCCDMFSVVHTQNDENGDESVETDPSKIDEKLEAKENLKEFISRPFRITCRKDLTTVLKRITALSSEFVLAEPLVHLQNVENTECALQQTIKLSAPVSEPTAESSESIKAEETVPVASKVELKKEIAPKSHETISQQSLNQTAAKKPCIFVSTEKRFKCPLCPKHFTIKKSVLRHLKSVHHKSEEQLERLKSRIQLYSGKKKNSLITKEKLPSASSTQSVAVATCSSPPTLVKPSATIPCPSLNNGAVSPTFSTKNDQNSEKGDWVKDCSLCGRNFVNRNTYSSHTRACRKNVLNEDNADSATAANDGSVLPIIPLTSVNVPVRTLNSPTKRLTPALSQKKVTLPLGSSLSATSSSKKIGIQVRMNYFKEGINQSGTTNGTPSGNAIPPSFSHTSSDSGQSSSITASKDAKSGVSKADLPSRTNTRSKAKLAEILYSLNKRGSKDENEEIRIITGTVREKRNEVSIYCENCKTTYLLNDQRWSSENDIPRSFKCALKDCDFRSSDRNELLPHLSAQHAILSENALAELKSIFIAESIDLGKHCCHKGTDKERSPDDQKLEVPGKSRVLFGTNPSLAKRKLNAESNTKSVKRKVLLQLKKDTITSVSTKVGSKATAEMNANDDDQKVVPKKMKESNRRTRTKKPVIIDDVALRNVIVPNGLQKSIGESRQFPSSKTLKKTNQLLDDMKVASKLPKINSFVNSTPFPLTTDTDLDPATMSEENLKKSVMTIIFGKDMPDENMDTNIVSTREKSPNLSSTSSDSGREKRYGLRAGKPISSAVTKDIISSLSENSDDKVLKIQILNKVKSASR